MFILDTDTFTHLQKGNQKVFQNLQNTDGDVAITIITRVEVLRGRFDYLLKATTSDDILKAQRLLNRSELSLSELVVIPFDKNSVAQFERLQSVKRLRNVGLADLLIGSIVLGYRATLVTRNLRHFKQIPNLRVVNWVD